MSAKAGRRNSGGKKKEEMMGKEILQFKKQMERDMKALKLKMKNELIKERARHRRELKDLQRQMSKKIEDERQIFNERLAELDTVADEEIRELKASTVSYVQQLQFLNIRITNLQENTDETMEGERRRRHNLTRRVRNQEVDLRLLASTIIN